jgi:hypothetical protein
MTTNANSTNWPYRWFGVFRERDDEPSQYPLLTEFQEPEWRLAESRKIVNYLNSAPNVLVTCAGQMSCPLCGLVLSRGSWRSDGVWLWPDDLGHYVEMHQVTLPDRFADWIEERDFVPPTSCSVPVSELPWPSD